MAYEFELSPGRKVNNVFHVSFQKKAIRQKVKTTLELPPLDDEGQLAFVLEAILEV